MKPVSFVLGLIIVAESMLGATFLATANMSTPSEADFIDAHLVENVPGNENQCSLEFWEIDEFKTWMEQQRAENQVLADRGDLSFYEKNADGDYFCRAWTQEDADALYRKWQEQLVMMEQGYHFTKTITLSDGGALAGAFDPEI